MQRHMILTDCSLQKGHSLSLTHLDEQFPAPLLNFTFQDCVTILRHPDEMDRQARDGMTTPSLLCHDGVC